MRDGSVKDFEVRLVTKQGKFLDGMVTASTWKDENGKVIANHGIMRDITEQKENEARIKASLEEKEILLKEINHRVKNNLQIISCLLSLQGREIQDPVVLQYFKNSQERIKAIVTLNKVSLLKLDLNKGFHSVQGGTTRGLRDIQAISKKIISFDDSEWAEAYTKIVIFEKGKTYTLGSRKIPILE